MGRRARSEPAGLDATVPVSIGATALHYGQSLFEGLKAFACKDGSVRLFRPTANAARMARGAARTLMEAPDEALFVEARARVVRENLDYVPPYGSGVRCTSDHCSRRRAENRPPALRRV